MMPSCTLRPLNGGALDWLVFGMAWEHVGGARPERRSLQRAKARQATHYIAAHEGSAATGLARLPVEAAQAKVRARTKAQRRYISAGVLFAAKRPNGVYVAQLDLQEDGIWLIASHDGVVIPGYDVVLDDAERVSEAITRLLQRYADAQSVETVQPTLEEARGNLQARLAQVKTSTQVIPPWMKVAAGLMLAYGLYTEGQSLWDEYQAEQDLVQNPTQHFDFNSERSKQLDAWQSGIHLDGPEGLRDVLRQIGSLPKGFDGWTLAFNGSKPSISCRPITTGWNCKALYSRTALGTNESFRSGYEVFKRRYELSEIQSSTLCAVGWVDLEKAQLTCQFSSKRRPLDRMAVDQTEAVNLGFIAQVQRVMLAFREVKVEPRTALKMDNPVVVSQRGDRLSLAPSRMETPQAHVPGVQGFSYFGPLRSLTVIPLTASSVIRSIDVQRIDLTDPTLNTSALRAELKGEMYVQ